MKQTLLPAAVLVSAVLVAGAGGAVAGSMITGKQIQDGSIYAKDLSYSTRTALRGLTKLSTVTAESAGVPDGDFDSVVATCPPGKKVLGSIAFWNNQHAVIETYTYNSDEVTAFGRNNDGATDFFTLRITCARTS